MTRQANLSSSSRICRSRGRCRHHRRTTLEKQEISTSNQATRTSHTAATVKKDEAKCLYFHRIEHVQLHDMIFGRQ